MTVRDIRKALRGLKHDQPVVFEVGVGVYRKLSGVASVSVMLEGDGRFRRNTESDLFAKEAVVIQIPGVGDPG